MHPPKISVFDVAAGVNVDNKGLARPVEEFRETTFGLYMSRAMVGRATSYWMQSWLLPDLGLCVTDWWWKPGHERDQDYYLDVCGFERDGERWRVTDLYLDIVVRDRRDLVVVDVDEYVAAVTEGLLSPDLAETALHRTTAAVAGLAAHGYDLDAWLGGHGITVTWLERPACGT